MPLQVNTSNMTSLQLNSSNMDVFQVDGVVKWRRPFTYTRGSLPTGVASISAEINYSVELYSQRVLATSDTIYFGEYIDITASPSTGYNLPTINTGSFPNPISGNVTGVNYVTAGSVKSYTFTVPVINGVGVQTLNRTSSPLKGATTGVIFNAVGSGSSVTVYHGDVITVTAAPATGYNNPTISGSPVTISGSTNTSSYITAGSIKQYTLTIVAITGVATQTITRYSSTYAGAPTGSTPLTDGSPVYYGDVLYFEATQSTGYNAPNIEPPDGDGYVTVTGNINSSDFILTGTMIAYTLTKGSVTGVSSYVVTRTSSPLAGAGTGVLTGGSIYYGDILTITSLVASTGYNTPSATTPITVTGNTNTSSYITRGSIKSYTLTINNITGVDDEQLVQRTSSPLQGAANGTLSNGAAIYHGDILTIWADPAEGFNNPTISGSPLTVTGSVSTSSYITRGSPLSYTLTKGAVTGVASYVVTRTSSPYAGAATGAMTGGTIYYGDILTITSLVASTGYNAPSATTPITVTGNINTANYITAGTASTSNVTITGRSDWMDGPTYSPGTRTCTSTFTATAATFVGKRKTSTMGVGYRIEKGGTTVKSGSASSFTMTSGELSAISGAGTITVHCTTTASQLYWYSAALTVTYIGT